MFRFFCQAAGVKLNLDRKMPSLCEAILDEQRRNSVDTATGHFNPHVDTAD